MQGAAAGPRRRLEWGTCPSAFVLDSLSQDCPSADPSGSPCPDATPCGPGRLGLGSAPMGNVLKEHRLLEDVCAGGPGAKLPAAWRLLVVAEHVKHVTRLRRLMRKWQDSGDTGQALDASTGEGKADAALNRAAAVLQAARRSAARRAAVRRATSQHDDVTSSGSSEESSDDVGTARSPRTAPVRTRIALAPHSPPPIPRAGPRQNPRSVGHSWKRPQQLTLSWQRPPLFFLRRLAHHLTPTAFASLALINRAWSERVTRIHSSVAYMQSPASGKSLSTRHRILQEIVETEQVYVNGLTVAVKDFMEPLTARGVPGALITRIFGNMTDVLAFHKKSVLPCMGAMLTLLHRSAAAQGPTASGIAEAISSRLARVCTMLCKGAPVYIEYAKFSEDGMHALDQLTSDKALSRVLQAVADQVDPLKRMPLASFLVAPVQRMLRYRLLFDSLLAATPEAHRDHHMLQQAVRSLHACARVMERQLESRDDAQRVARLSASIVGLPETVLPPGVKLHRQGQAEVLRLRKGSFSVRRSNTVHLAVLSNTLVVSRVRSEADFAYWFHVPLKGALVRPATVYEGSGDAHLVYNSIKEGSAKSHKSWISPLLSRFSKPIANERLEADTSPASLVGCSVGGSSSSGTSAPFVGFPSRSSGVFALGNTPGSNASPSSKSIVCTDSHAYESLGASPSGAAPSIPPLPVSVDASKASRTFVVIIPTPSDAASRRWLHVRATSAVDRDAWLHVLREQCSARAAVVMEDDVAPLQVYMWVIKGPTEDRVVAQPVQAHVTSLSMHDVFIVVYDKVVYLWLGSMSTAWKRKYAFFYARLQATALDPSSSPIVLPWDTTNGTFWALVGAQSADDVRVTRKADDRSWFASFGHRYVSSMILPDGSLVVTKLALNEPPTFELIQQGNCVLLEFAAHSYLWLPKSATSVAVSVALRLADQYGHECGVVRESQVGRCPMFKAMFSDWPMQYWRLSEDPVTGSLAVSARDGEHDEASPKPALSRLSRSRRAPDPSTPMDDGDAAPNRVIASPTSTLKGSTAPRRRRDTHELLLMKNKAQQEAKEAHGGVKEVGHRESGNVVDERGGDYGEEEEDDDDDDDSDNGMDWITAIRSIPPQ